MPEMIEIPTAALGFIVFVIAPFIIGGIIVVSNSIGHSHGRVAGEKGLAEAYQEAADLRKKVAEAYNKIDALTAKRQELTTALENTLRVAKERKNDLAQALATADELKNAINNLKADRERALDTARTEIDALRDEKERIKNGLCLERDKANDLWRSSEESLQKAQLELDEARGELDFARAELANRSKALSDEEKKRMLEICNLEADLKHVQEELDKAEDRNQNLVRCLYDLQTQAWNDLAQAERTKDKIEDALKRWAKEDPSVVTTVSCVSAAPPTHFSVVSERVSIPDSQLSIAPQGVSCRVPEMPRACAGVSEFGVPILTKAKKLEALVHCVNTEAYEDAAGHLCDLLEYCRMKIGPVSMSLNPKITSLHDMVDKYGAHPTPIEDS